MDQKLENKKKDDGYWSGITDEELIEKFQNGDVYSFDMLVKRYKDQLMNFVYRFLGNVQEAEDVVQDTFLRVYRNRHAYRRVAKFSTWIYTIAGNLAKTELRKRKRRKLFSLTDLGFDEKEFELESPDLNPEASVHNTMQDDIIQSEIQKLSPKFKQVILLRDVQGLSYEEIAVIINTPLGTVKSRVNRARLKLQEELTKALDLKKI